MSEGKTFNLLSVVKTVFIKVWGLVSQNEDRRQRRAQAATRNERVDLPTLSSTDPVPATLLSGEGSSPCYLLKFFFTNPKHVPEGIEKRERESAEDLNKRLREMAEQYGIPNLAEVGRLRDGKIDTGEDVVNNLGFVQVAMLRRGFASNGYGLMDAFYHEQESGSPRSSTKKLVVTLIYGKISPDVTWPVHDRKVTDAIRSLATMTWGYAHVWWNHPVPTTTINLVNLRQREAKGSRPEAQVFQPDPPRHALVARNRCLCHMQVSKPISEDAE